MAIISTVSKMKSPNVVDSLTSTVVNWSKGPNIYRNYSSQPAALTFTNVAYSQEISLNIFNSVAQAITLSFPTSIVWVKGDNFHSVGPSQKTVIKFKSDAGVIRAEIQGTQVRTPEVDPNNSSDTIKNVDNFFMNEPTEGSFNVSNWEKISGTGNLTYDNSFSLNGMGRGSYAVDNTCYYRFKKYIPVSINSGIGGFIYHIKDTGTATLSVGFESYDKDYNRAGGGSISDRYFLLNGHACTTDLAYDSDICYGENKINLTTQGSGTVNALKALNFLPTDVSIDGSTFNKSAHGFVLNDIVKIYATVLPSPLSSGTSYYVVNPTVSTFQLSAAPSGAPITLTNNGSGTTTFYKQVFTFTTTDVSFGDATGTVTITGHGLSAGTAIRFTTSGTLPSPLSNVTTYYVTNPAPNTFQISTTYPVVSPVSLSTSGAGTQYLYAQSFTFSPSDVTIAGNIFTIQNHGLAGNLPVKFYSSGTLPSGLSIGTTYYVINLTLNTFQVSSTAGPGAPNTISNAGNGTHSLMAQAFTFNPADVTITGNTFTIPSHGLANDTPVRLISTGTLPSGLSTYTTYYVVNQATNTFQLSGSIGGGAILLSNNGSGTQYFTKQDLTFNPADVTYQGSTFNIPSHGFINDNVVRFSGINPAPLNAGQNYYIANKTNDTFQVSTSSGGVGIQTLTDVGSYGGLGWSNTGLTLPGNLSSSQSVIIDDYVYLFGGQSAGVATNVIYRALTSTPTTWVNTGSVLPSNLEYSQSAVIGNYVYLFGGFTGALATNAIYRAPISNPTSGWVNTGSVLPAGLYGSQLAVIGSYVYLFGGIDPNGSDTSIIYRASTSDPLTWASVGNLPSPAYGSQLAVIGSYVYLFGGSYNTIYRASTSDPLTWSNVGSLPVYSYFSQIAVLEDYIFLFGGVSNNTIYVAEKTNPLTWYYAGNIPANLAFSQVKVIGPYIYLFGGNTGGATDVNTIYRSIAYNPYIYFMRVNFSTANVDIVNEYITSNSHGLVDGDYIYMTTTGTLPSPLGNASYYIIQSTPNTFKLATTLGGSAIALNTTGSGNHTVWKLSKKLWPENISIDLITKTSHGLTEGQGLCLITGGTLPTPLSSTSYYYAVNVTPDTFSISSTPYGIPINLTSQGTGIHTIFKNFSTQTGYTYLSIDIITKTSHGILEGNPIMFSNSGGALPTGITNSLAYYAKDVTTNTFKVAASSGGTPIDLSAQGSGVHSCHTLKYSIGYSDLGVDTIYKVAHGFTDGTRISFSTTGTLPTGLSAGTSYFVIGATTDTFKVSTTSGGAPIDLTAIGTGTNTCYKTAFTLTNSSYLQGVDIINKTSHGLFDNNVIVLSTSSSLPSPLLINTGYYIVASTVNSFKLSTTLGGTPVDLTTLGVGTQTVYLNTVLMTDESYIAPDSITYINHGMSEGAPLLFGGAGSLPTGLSTGTNYYAKDVTTNTFKVSTTFGGTVVNITSQGSGDMCIMPKSFVVFTATDVNITDNTITKINHTFSNDDIVFLQSTSLPAGLIQWAPYYVVQATPDTFKVSLTVNGPEVDITTVGSGNFYCYKSLFIFLTQDVNTSLDYITKQQPQTYGEGARVYIATNGTLPTPLLTEWYYIQNETSTTFSFVQGILSSRKDFYSGTRFIKPIIAVTAHSGGNLYISGLNIFTNNFSYRSIFSDIATVAYYAS